MQPSDSNNHNHNKMNDNAEQATIHESNIQSQNKNTLQSPAFINIFQSITNDILCDAVDNVKEGGASLTSTDIISRSDAEFTDCSGANIIRFLCICLYLNYI